MTGQPPEDRKAANRQYILDVLAVSRNTKLSELLPADAFADAPRVWIVGGGPSLKSFDWDKLRGEVVLGVNRAYELPNVGMMVSMDMRYKRWVVAGDFGDDSWDLWKAFTGPKVFTVLPNTPLSYAGDEKFYCVDRHSHQYIFPPTLEMLGAGGQGINSGWMALQLAWALGARHINLLGFDMKGTADKRQAWWHSGYPKQTDSSCYNRFQGPFNRGAPVLQADGIHVTNFCWDSALSCFHKADDWTRDLLLAKKPERPLVIGYYTVGTSYEQEIKGMVQSARAHGLEVHIEGIASEGSWTKNTYYKARFIGRKLLEYPNRPLLFLDADSRIRRYPAWFDNLPADFAATEFKWGEWGKKGRPNEISTAVMYLRSVPAVRDLVREWIRRNDSTPMRPCQDQRNLTALVDEWRNSGRLNFIELPPTYCQIFDSMAHLGAPVIEQMQASRRFKKEIGA